MHKRNVLNSPRLLEINRKRKKIFLRKAGALFFVLVLVMVAFVFFLRWEKINIKEVKVSGNVMVDSEDVLSAVSSELDQKYLWFIPKTNFIFYPKNKIKDTLAREFPRLENIDVSLEGVSLLHIKLSERVGAFIWCGDSIIVEEGEEECYFMDKTGYIFDSAPYFSDDVYFKFFGKLGEGKDSPLGQKFLEGKFEALVDLEKNIEELGVRPYALFAKEDKDAEFYLVSNLVPPDAQKIIFKQGDDFIKVAENLQAALSTEPLKSDLKEKYSLLSYIDLRFGNKVYFKFKE